MASATKQSLRVLACFDKFKDSIDATGIGSATVAALQTAFPGQIAETNVLALSDGGDGFLATLQAPLGLAIHSVDVVGPLGRPVTAQYGVTAGGEAVVEMALAAGLQLVPGTERDPDATTSYGVGQVVAAAYQQGCRRFTIGLGGSANSDGGVGAVQALLGVQPVLRDGSRPDVFFGRHLHQLASIELPESMKGARVAMPDCEFALFSDVTNPLLGPKGAVATFARQKGANDVQMQQLEAGMQTWDEVVARATGRPSVAMMPGMGAAGGIAYALASFVNTVPTRGIDYIAGQVRLAERIAEADVVITGEGCYDAQSDDGKVVSLVQHLCLQQAKPCVIVCGAKTADTADRPNVYDLVSVVGAEASMKDPAGSVVSLIKQHGAKILALAG